MALILVFAKEPVPGRVKTRLVPPLTEDEAARIASAFLQDTFRTLDRIAGARAAVAIPDDSSEEAIAALLGADVPLVRQGPGDLGERLARATRLAFEHGEDPVAVVGGDHPDLPAPLVEACLADARRGLVGWIPTEDGGYAALALPEPLPGLFRRIPWSTAGVAAATCDNAARLGVEMVEHGPWHDVDTPEDLARLSRVLDSSEACPATRRVLNALAPPLEEREGDHA